MDMHIYFKYSPQHERALGGSVDSEKAARAVRDLERLWKDNKDSIVKEMRAITGLSFSKQEIACYLNSKHSYSDPLSIEIESKADMLDNLVHELIHVLFTQNYPTIKKSWDIYWKKAGNLSFGTKAHIPVHAVHYLIAKKIFPRRLKRIISYSENPDYVASWNIVLQENPVEIIRNIFGDNK